MNLTIRNEKPSDYRAVEILTRNAFWNLYIPGCHEHYVAHILREHEDFVPELDLVAETDEGKIVGSVMYTKAKLTDEKGAVQTILTFGPLCVDPEHQRQGISKKLLNQTFEQALALGYKAIVIFGNPGNYVARGFKSCKKYNVCAADGSFPSAMLVKELMPGVFDGRKWVYADSSAFQFDEGDAEQFDQQFEPKEKEYLPCQEEFYIHSHSVIR